MKAALKDIIDVLDSISVEGDLSAPVFGASHDSRSIQSGWIFVAVPGLTRDGNDFVPDALKAGAAAVISERPRQCAPGQTVWIRVPDARKALAQTAAAINGQPTADLTLVGITGTNGKTTLTFLLEAIARAAGKEPGVVGTITYRWAGNEIAAVRTTPEASELQSTLRAMADHGVTHVFAEISSHGLQLKRLYGCRFDVAVFTNLSQDHLDFHHDMEDYYLAKRLLFTDLLATSSKPGKTAVVNLDDPYGRRLAGEITGLQVLGFGIDPVGAIYPESYRLGSDGISASIKTPSGTIAVNSRLTGEFNLSNILAACAVSKAVGFDHAAVSRGIEAATVIPGRLERVPSAAGCIFVDYAHSPQALKNVLDALRPMVAGRVITIMGCGGDRDKTKRPLMGMEAAAGSDFVVVTSDNPRSEDPMTIIDQIVPGVQERGYREYSDLSSNGPLPSEGYCVIPDRREAVFWAVKRLGPDDGLLVAGKGHETYQEINGVRHDFDDRQVVREALDSITRGRHSADGKTHTGSTAQ